MGRLNQATVLSANASAKKSALNEEKRKKQFDILKESQYTIENEALLYGDILAFEVDDNVYNDSLIGLGLYEWLYSDIRCFQSRFNTHLFEKYIVRVSDTVFVNPDALLEAINRFQMRTSLKPDPLTFIFGHIVSDRNTSSSRNHSSLNDVPLSVWTYQKWNFPILSPEAYGHRLLLIPLIIDLLNYCIREAFYNDQIFITGFIPYMLNVELRNDEYFFRGADPDWRIPTLEDFLKQAILANLNITRMNQFLEYRNYLLAQVGSISEKIEDSTSSSSFGVEKKAIMNKNEARLSGSKRGKFKNYNFGNRADFCSFFKNVDLSICPSSSNLYFGCSEPLTYR